MKDFISSVCYILCSAFFNFGVITLVQSLYPIDIFGEIFMTIFGFIVFVLFCKPPKKGKMTNAED